MTIRLFNTLTNTVEDLVPSDGETLRIYVCGPTAFVESISVSLIELGLDAELIRTELATIRLFMVTDSYLRSTQRPASCQWSPW